MSCCSASTFDGSIAVMLTAFWHDLGAVLLAFALGAAVGAEREWRRHPGGLRSLALVAAAACAFTRIILGVGGNNPAAGIGALATGIGFLGAGVILHHGLQVRGLSTASSFWTVAAMGCAIGADMFGLGLALGGVLLFTHVALRRLSGWIDRRAPPDDTAPR